MTTTVPALNRRAVGLAWFTILYNAAEGVLTVAGGIAAGATSLVGFGLDSGIEVLSAIVVLTAVRAELAGRELDERREHIALRIIAVTFFLLAAYLAIDGIRDLASGSRPEVSLLGIVVTAVSIVVMPTLAALKARTGHQLGSAIILADAAETRLCALLSVSTFLGLLGYSIFGWTWLDPVAGFVIAAFAVMEGREAWSGDHD